MAMSIISPSSKPSSLSHAGKDSGLGVHVRPISKGLDGRATCRCPSFGSSYLSTGSSGPSPCFCILAAISFLTLRELAFPSSHRRHGHESSHKSHNLAAASSLVALAQQSRRICMLLEAFVPHLPGLLSAPLQESLSTLAG